MAYECLQSGGAAPIILSCANEVAVASFLAGRIGFLDIAPLVEQTLSSLSPGIPRTLDDVSAVDALAREKATVLAQSLAR